MDLFLARQPIFDRHTNVHAYELLYRSSANNAFDGTDDTAASLQVISNSFLTFGFDKVSCGRPCFINLGRELLLEGCLWLTPPSSFVIEVLETVPRDREVYQACKRLRDQGFTIALDDFIMTNRDDPLIELAQIIKIDLRGCTRQEAGFLRHQLHGRGVELLAEKVETQEEFQWAFSAGFHYFQGYFFARPQLMSSKEIPGFKLNYMRILTEVHKPEIQLDALEQQLRCEASLTRRLLRYINSSVFHWTNEISSIRQSLSLLGECNVRRWVTLAALPGLATDKPNELVMNAMVRARFCELLAPLVGLEQLGEDLFLLGMFSHLDAMLDCPIEKVLADFPTPASIRLTLLGKSDPDNPVALLFALVQHYERADWPALELAANGLRLKTDEITPSYRDALDWADQIFQGSPASTRLAG